MKRRPNKARPMIVNKRNTTGLQVSPSSHWPMSSVISEISCMPKQSTTGCLSFCLTLAVIPGPDGCTCPNEVGNCPEHNAFGDFDHMGIQDVASYILLSIYLSNG